MWWQFAYQVWLVYSYISSSISTSVIEQHWHCSTAEKHVKKNFLLNLQPHFLAYLNGLLQVQPLSHPRPLCTRIYLFLPFFSGFPASLTSVHHCDNLCDVPSVLQAAPPFGRLATPHSKLRYRVNYFLDVLESPSVHSKSFIYPSWDMVVKYFLKLELHLMSAAAQRKESPLW